MARDPLLVTFHVRGKEIAVRNLRNVRRHLVKRCGSTAYNAALHLKARSQAVVPYEEGDLYDSAYVAPISSSEDKQVWGVGYDVGKAPHAILVHEIPGRMHPTRGPSPEPKQDHYLEEPANAMKKEWPRTVRDDLRDELKHVPIQRLRGSR